MRRPSKPRRISQLLNQQGTLGALSVEVSRQQQLLGNVQAALPAKLAAHCNAARLQGGVLKLFTDTPVWLSKLRFQAPGLLSRLRADYPGIASISVRCKAPKRGISRAKVPAPRRPHSRQAATTVGQSAAGITDPALRYALVRLAKTLDKP